jgi:hypothetical protein
MLDVCHPERSARRNFRPASFAGRVGAESKDPYEAALHGEHQTEQENEDFFRR